MLPIDLLEIIADYLHCDIVQNTNGIQFQLRPTKYFELRLVDDQFMVFPCKTQ